MVWNPFRRETLEDMTSTRSDSGIRINEYTDYAELVVIDFILGRARTTDLVNLAESHRSQNEMGPLYEVKRKKSIAGKLERTDDGTKVTLTEEEKKFFQNPIDISRDSYSRSQENDDQESGTPGKIYVIRHQSLYLHTSQGMFKAMFNVPDTEHVMKVFGEEVYRDVKKGMKDAKPLSVRHRRNIMAQLESEAVERYSGDIVLLKAYSQGSRTFVNDFYSKIRELTRGSHPSA